MCPEVVAQSFDGGRPKTQRLRGKPERATLKHLLENLEVER